MSHECKNVCAAARCSDLATGGTGGLPAGRETSRSQFRRGRETRAEFVDEDSSGTLNTGDTDVAEYTWDYRNRLVAVTNRATYGGDATQAVDYIYDVNNRLVGKILDPDGEGEDPATEEYYVYDGDQILLRFDGPDLEDVRNRYLWAPTVDLLLSDEKLTAPDENSDIYLALGDNLNTDRDIARSHS